MTKGKYSAWLEPEKLEQLERWAAEGLTDVEIAENMGICLRTLGRWKKEHPQIAEALKRGTETADDSVEQALLKRALGYDHDEVTREMKIDPETGEESLKSVKIVTKHVMPNISAQLYWLKNRRPSVWRDRPVSEASSQPSELLRSLCALMEEQ